MHNRAAAIVVLAFAAFMDLIDATIVNVALPSIQQNLHASPAQLEWIVGGYTLAFAAVLITGGRLGDIFGRRRIFILGVAGFTLSSLLASIAPNGAVLVVARILQGGCAALMAPQLLSTVQSLFAPKERAPIYGMVGGISGLAAVVGPLLGGALVSSNAFGIGWRSTFLINVPVGVVLICAAIVWVPNTRSEHVLRLDVNGVVLATAGILLLVYPLVQGRQQGWPGWIWAMLIASPAVFGVFVGQQRRRFRADRSALLPMSLFGNRGFSAGLITQLTFQGAMAAFALILAIYLQTGLHFSAIDAGLTLLPFSIGAFVGSGIAIPLGIKIGKSMMVAGALAQALAMIWIGHIVSVRGDSLSGWDLLWPMVAAGIGLGLLVVPLIDVALATVPVGDAGSASGTYSTFQQVGAAVGVSVVGVVFFGAGGADFSSPGLRHAFEVGMWVAVAGYLISGLASLFLPRRVDVLAHAATQALVLEGV